MSLVITSMLVCLFTLTYFEIHVIVHLFLISSKEGREKEEEEEKFQIQHILYNTDIHISYISCITINLTCFEYVNVTKLK